MKYTYLVIASHFILAFQRFVLLIYCYSASPPNGLRYPLVGGVDKCPAIVSASGVDNDCDGAESHKSGVRCVRPRSTCANRSFARATYSADVSMPI